MKAKTLLFLSLLLPEIIFCQLTGIKTIPGDYPTITSAISALNTQGAGPGGVVFNINAGYTESFSSPTAGYITTNTGSLSDPIIFQKSGSGANPKITAATGTGTMDAIICFNGVKYITFDGIDIQDKSANTNPTTRMEWGYAILKASGIQGSQNITITNCSISLIKNYNATYAIYSNNHTSSSIAQLTVTSVSGQNSNNKFYGNSISSSYNGIYLNGYRDTNPPYLFYDQGNDIGSVTGNNITNFGGNVADAYCIQVKFQNDITIANSSINGGNFTLGNLYGIFGDTAMNANVNIYSNNVTLTGRPAQLSMMYAIYNSALGIEGIDNTINIYNNVIQNCTSSSIGFSRFYGCCNKGNGHTVNFHDNLVSGNNLPFAFNTIYLSVGNSPSGSCTIYNNTVFNNHSVDSVTTNITAYLICLEMNGTGSKYVHNNLIYENTLTNDDPILYGIRGLNQAVSQTITDNVIHDITIRSMSGDGTIVGIYSYPEDSAIVNISGNNVYNLTATAVNPGFFWIAGMGCCFVDTCSNNVVSNISVACSDGGNAQVNGLVFSAITRTMKFYNNRINNISCSGKASHVDGLGLGIQSQIYAYNNYISDIRAPNDTIDNSVNGIIVKDEGYGSSFYNNTIYLNTTSSSTGTFGTNGIFVNTNVNVDLRNNIVINTSSAPNSSSFKTVAYRRSSPSLSTYSLASNNNDFYAGTPGPNNLIFFDGTNADQTLADYKARVFPRDSATVTENPPFVNISSAPYDLHIQPNTSTLVESHGLIVTSPAITTDFDDEPRFPNPGYPNNLSYPATAPDIGADEFAGGPGIPLPVAITDPATNVTSISARLNGTVNANGQTSSVSFQWGLTTSYTNTVQGVPGTVGGSTATAIIADLPGLLINQTYHFRIVATNAGGTSYGQDRSFTTLCPLPSAPGAISGPLSVCQSGTGYIYSVGVIPEATSYQWTVPSGGSISNGSGTNSITVDFSPTAVSGDVTVAAIGTCGTGPSSSLPVTVNSLPDPASGITGDATVCAGTSGVIYSTTEIANTTSYQWSVPSGATVVSGSGTNSITVDFSTSAVSGDITVFGTNGCGNGSPAVFPVTVNPLPVPTISGDNSACPGVIKTYVTQPGMTGYAWNVSTGGTITGGGNTDQITILWSTPGVQTVSVNYTDGSGCSALTPGSLTVTVEPLPSPGISGTTSLCVNSGYYNYVTEQGFFNYQWTISPGGIIISGNGTDQVQVSWTGAGQQWVAVDYSTSSGCSAPEPTMMDVTVNDIPSPALTISGTDVVCAGVTGIQYSTAVIPGAMTYVWIIPGGCSGSSGSGTNTITVDFSESAVSGNIIVQGNNLCGNGIPSPEFPVTVNPIPSTPVVTLLSDTLISSSPSGNQWFYKQYYTDPGAPIAGATDQRYVVTQNGYYWTLITQNGCESDTSNNVHVVWIGVANHTPQAALQVYPVPNNGNFTLSFYAVPMLSYSIKVYNSTGSSIYELNKVYGSGPTEMNLNLGNVARGIYFLVLSDGVTSWSFKILVI